MRNAILTSTSALALIMFSLPALAQMNPNMPGMSMGSTSSESTPSTTANKTDQASPTDGAKGSMSMKGMDMSKMAAGNGKHGCGMHMTKASMSMDSGNHRCMEHRHFQMTHPGGTGSR